MRSLAPELDILSRQSAERNLRLSRTIFVTIAVSLSVLDASCCCVHNESIMPSMFSATHDYNCEHRVQRRCFCRQNIKTRRKPLKKWVILIALQFRYTFYIPQTKRLRVRKIVLLLSSVALRATCCAPARLWLAVIDFPNGEQQSRSGSDKKRRNRLQ